MNAFLQTFLEEAIDLLEEWEATTVSLAENFSTEGVQVLFRVAHSLKGSAKSVDLEDFGNFVHLAEDIMTQVVESPTKWDHELAELFTDLADFLTQWRSGIQSHNDHVPSDLAAWQQRLNQYTQTSEKPVLAAFGIFDEDEPPASKQVQENPGEPPPPSTTKDSQAATMRVPIPTIDNLTRTIGEMTVAIEILKEFKRKGDYDAQLVERTIDDLGQLSLEAHEQVMDVRLQPVSSLFQRLERICRDTAKKLGKQVRIQLKGDDTELDKGLLEKIKDPLVHIVRNAIDHGIETSSERAETQKPSEATVVIAAFSTGMQTTIRVSDDGKGIHKDRILAKALEKGLIDSPDQIPESEVLNLILQPGFSTASQVTDISGRGVGMDVVRSRVEELGGEITISSTEGSGSCFDISLPSTIKIVDSLIIRDNHQTYALPLDDIAEVFMTTEVEIGELDHQRHFLKRDDKVIPIVMLAELLEQPCSSVEEKAGVVVEGRFGSKAALFDSIERKQTIFLRPLEGRLKQRKSFQGSAILSNGEPAIVLNLFALMEGQHGHGRAA